MAAWSEARTEQLYTVIDAHPGFYRGQAQPAHRSRMNVTFHLPDAPLTERFLRQSHAEGLFALKGHAILGGIRASLYNAMPFAGAEALGQFMAHFAKTHG